MLHDDGEGGCAPLGICAPRHTLFHVDHDGDGYGGTGRDDLCAPQGPPPAMYVADGSDCDDANGAVWRIVFVYPDDDHDGIHGPPRGTCMGANPPTGSVFDPVPATAFSEVPLFVGSDYQAQGWSYLEAARRIDGIPTTVTLPPNTRSSRLTLRGFHLHLTGMGLTTLTVHLRVLASAVNTAVVENLRLRVGMGVSPVVSPIAIDTVNGLVTVRRPSDAWSLGLTDAVVSGEDLAVEFNVFNPTGSTVDVSFDGAMLEAATASGATDCDDQDLLASSPWTGFTDADRDGHGAGAAIPRCVGVTTNLAGLAEKGDDCDDAAPDAFPGSGSFSVSARANGSFDFDCDGVETKADAYSDYTCDDDGTGICLASGDSFTPTEPCGAMISLDECRMAHFGCGLEQFTVAVACR